MSSEVTWTRVAGLNDIPEEQGLAIEIQGEQLALFREGEDIHCLEDNCPHRGAALSEGLVRNGEVVCPWHGWRFGLEDGECSSLPGSMPATVFPVRVDGDSVLVDLAGKRSPRSPASDGSAGQSCSPPDSAGPSHEV